MARFYPEDVRDDCLYTIKSKPGEALCEYTGYRITADDGKQLWIIPLAPDAVPDQIRVRPRPRKYDPPSAKGKTYRDRAGQHYHDAESTRHLLAWDLQCEKEGKVIEAVRELFAARRSMELGDSIDFTEILPGVFKMQDFEIYAFTRTARDQIAEFIEEQEFRRCIVGDLDEAREWILKGTGLRTEHDPTGRNPAEGAEHIPTVFEVMG